MRPELVDPAERVYFIVLLVISVLVYLGSIVTVLPLFYLLTVAGVAFVAQGLLVGYLKGNAVRVGPGQFAKLYETATRISQELGLNRVPEVYVLQAGGTLNAFATRFFGRDFVVLYSDVVELALEQGDHAVEFVLAHEIAHVARKHLSRRWMVLPGLAVPFLGGAYQRACEFTCDRAGAYVSAAGAVDGIMVLASGKRLYRQMNAGEFARQTHAGGFWCWLSAILSTHPTLPRRLAAVTAVAETAFGSSAD